MTRRELFGRVAAALALPFVGRQKSKTITIEPAKAITVTLPAMRPGEMYCFCVNGQWQIHTAPGTAFTIR